MRCQDPHRPAAAAQFRNQHALGFDLIGQSVIDSTSTWRAPGAADGKVRMKAVSARVARTSAISRRMVRGSRVHFATSPISPAAGNVATCGRSHSCRFVHVHGNVLGNRAGVIAAIHIHLQPVRSP